MLTKLRHGQENRVLKLKRHNPPTLNDVAREAGLSAQTISNFLTGRTQPRRKNLERIQEAIHRLNYRPSAAARALRLRQSNILGLILEDALDENEASPQEIWEPLHTMFLHGATTKAREHDFYVTTVLARHGETEAHASRLIREGRADGLIFSAEVMSEQRLDRIQAIAKAERVPMVLLQENTVRKGVCSVCAEDEVGAREAAMHLHQLGHRNVAVVTVEPVWPGPVRRANAFIAAAKNAGMTVYDWSAQYSVDAVRARISEDLARQDRPTAVFAVNDVIAVAVIQQALELGISVPDQLSVIGFNDLDVASYFRPAITTVRTPAKEMGARAAEILIGSISGEPLIANAVLPVEFICRDSTAKPPGDRTVT
jgi:DNA-binding LacI/PurR family transcriptional regulator